jgi:hypothetical protein
MEPADLCAKLNHLIENYSEIKQQTRMLHLELADNAGRLVDWLLHEHIGLAKERAVHA